MKHLLFFCIELLGYLHIQRIQLLIKEKQAKNPVFVLYCVSEIININIKYLHFLDFPLLEKWEVLVIVVVNFAKGN